MSTPGTEERSRLTTVQAHMAKGFGFDQLIVQGVSAKYFSTQMDRCVLYVAISL